jgi:hypothetical protein
MTYWDPKIEFDGIVNLETVEEGAADEPFIAGMVRVYDPNMEPELVKEIPVDSREGGAMAKSLLEAFMGLKNIYG